MRFVKEIVPISLKDKSAVQTERNADYSISLAVGENGCRSVGVADRGIRLPDGINAVRYYRAGDDDYAFCADGYLYRITSDGIDKVTVNGYDEPPEVFTAESNGQKLIAVADNQNLTVIGKEILHTRILCADKYIRYRGRAFAVKGRKLYFGGCRGKLSDADVTTDSFIICPEKFGCLTGVALLNGGLYVFAEHGVMKVKSGAGNFDVSVSEVCMFSPIVAEGTVCAISDKAYFTDGERLYVFSGFDIDVADSMLDGTDFTLNGAACVAEGRYLLPVRAFGEEYLYCLDTKDCSECFIPAKNLLVSRGGFAINTATGELSVIKAKTEKWRLVLSETNLGSRGKKTLHSVKIYADRDLTVVISGEGISKKYSVKSRMKTIYPNMYSEFFRITVCGEGSGLSGLKIAYEYIL